LLPIERKQEEEEAQTKGIKRNLRKRYVQHHKGFQFGFDHNN
jgi:hypothetical protein